MALYLSTKRLLQKQVASYISSRPSGYVILLPEIGEDLQGRNPLLQPDGLPQFSHIAIENCMAMVGKQTLEYQTSLKELEEKIEVGAVENVFEDVIDPLETIAGPLELTWGISKALYVGNGTKMPTKSYLAIHERAKRARATKFHSVPVFKAVTQELQKVDRNEEQKRVLQKFHLEGKLNGLDLDAADRTQLLVNLTKLQTEKVNFKTKVEQATKGFKHTIVDRKSLEGVPDTVLKTLANSRDHLKGPWTVTLKPHVYRTFLQHCPDRNLRWNVWQAMVSRCSGYNTKEYSTSLILEQIRAFRAAQAKQLGYETFADMSMETKMAESVAKVKDVTQLLLEPSKCGQEKELNEMHEFALNNGFKGSRIELWDVPYWQNQQRLQLLNCTDQDFQRYFPLPQVLRGLFEICNQLFGITIRERSGVSTWHKSVKYYEVFEGSAPISGFYFDPHPPSKEDSSSVNYNHGWMVGIRNRSKINDQKPLASLVFNFKIPTNPEEPVLLTFKDLQLLFHKFGQALQHLTTRASYSEVAGLSNVEWDMVETSGHVFSHLLHRKSTIDLISCHYETGDKLPQEVFEALIKSENLTAGIDLSRELYLSHLDLDLHSTKTFWLDLVKNLWPQYRLFPLDKSDSHPCSFTQIFAEEWGAAYFSHWWSRMVAADVSSAFDEAQGDEQTLRNTGKRFRDTFLAYGGSCSPGQIFRKFRGRDPCPKALLRSLQLLE